ncbi:uncharacterized protein (TIGR01319 family) [Tamaricihabitans halophyticus]|uniref:Uncharacterized protein (TIGR01319 family) n=1 Tax=Tamaricihabitans halophyticus TaxID=1262583 RepID=A0A4R2QL28_9PSEU|nr:glutamate mutase L [Tamaricihabitans halophyticus]TCP49228.1 uncharacterized protein (TIGR01319 family) [Tamaricihabitans halophyticus]
MRWLCLDIGSTWTKAALLDEAGDYLGGAQHPTSRPDVLAGVQAVTEELAAADAETLACSSAGGGLRLAVVGQERLISAEAGHRVALAAGAKVVHIAAGELDGPALTALRAAEPDVLLLTGGTDDGDEKVLLHNAARIARNRLRVPIVLAGNIAARERAEELLRGRTVFGCANVLPDIGELEPAPAREAIRAVFLRHVIGGKGLSGNPRFRRMVRTVTPDAVLSGVARLGSVLGQANPDAAEQGAVLVVDVGGATTDVYSAVGSAEVDAQPRSVRLPDDRRTVEGDIGMRFSAPGLVAEAVAEGLIEEDPALHEAAAVRASDVDGLVGEAERAREARMAGLATILAVRRHLRLIDGRLGPHGAAVLVLSGGVFRHAGAAQLAEVESMLRQDPVLRPQLRGARVVVDRRYVLAPAGLLADSGLPAAADRLLGELATPRDRVP